MVDFPCSRQPAFAISMFLFACMAISIPLHATEQQAASDSVGEAGKHAGDDGRNADSGSNGNMGDTVAEASPQPQEPEAETDSDHPLWMDVYGEGDYSGHENRNLAGFSEYKLGKRIPFPVPVDIYAKLRLYRDSQNFYWNNRADAGLGARIPLLKKVSLSLFGEIVEGQYLHLSSLTVPMDRLQGRIDQNRAVIDASQKEFQAMYQEIFKADLLQDTTLNRQTLHNLDSSGILHLQTLDRLNARLDSLETSKDSLRQVMDSLALVPAGPITEYRAGLVFWYGWGQPSDNESKPKSWFSFPGRWWGDVYSDCIVSALSRHVRTRGGGVDYHDSLAQFRNLIFYANPNIGLVVMEGLAGSVVAYATTYVTYDTHKDWWNNVASAGPGIRYLPFLNLDLALKAEYLVGRYYGRERKQDPNPYQRSFRDLRISASFWYGLGV